MYQKDYILKMIEMMAELILGIMGLIKNRKFQDASEKLEEIYYSMLKEDAVFFRSIPIEKLTDELVSAHNYTNGHLEILSELFIAEAELSRALGKIDVCIEFSKKALLLAEFIDREENTFSFDREKKIKELRQNIEMLNKKKR